MTGSLRVMIFFVVRVDVENKQPLTLGVKKNGVWGFKLSISMAEIETPVMDLFEAIGIRKSLPTTNGWPLLLCLFRIGRRWTIRGGYFRRNPLKNRQQKCQRNVLWECTNASFPKDVKSILLGPAKGSGFSVLPRFPVPPKTKVPK